MINGVLIIANNVGEKMLKMKGVFEQKCKDPSRKEQDCERTSLAVKNEKMVSIYRNESDRIMWANVDVLGNM